jgi:hypothetical protein
MKVSHRIGTTSSAHRQVVQAEDVDPMECVTVGDKLVRVANLSGTEMLALVMEEVRKEEAAQFERGTGEPMKAH